MILGVFFKHVLSLSSSLPTSSDIRILDIFKSLMDKMASQSVHHDNNEDDDAEWPW